MRQIGSDLREVYGSHYRPELVGQLGSVVNVQTLRVAMGLPAGKLPVGAVDAQLIGDTYVGISSRAVAELMAPNSHRPHRMFARCNHCGRWIPVGRFGQHLGLYRIGGRTADGKPRYGKPCKERVS
jgi:hypothetical protein